MKPRFALFVFFVLMSASVGAGIDSLLRVGREAHGDAERALALTIAQCGSDRIDADTIRVYRRHLATAALRDTAYLSMEWRGEGRERRAVVAAHTGLSVRRMWELSDQRASGSLAAAAAVWLALSLWWIGRQRRRVAGAVCMGRLQYCPEVGRFFADGHEVRLTPMQRTLMEMFLVAEEHSLSQREICDRLWPRKPDASATLYTLMRRLRPVIEEKAGLRIECLRGEAYRLKES